MSLAQQSGLILSARVGKHTDAFLEELITRLQVEQLLSAFEIELLDEEEHPGTTALGEKKHCICTILLPASISTLRKKD